MDPVQEFLLMKRGALKKCSGCGKMAEVGADGKCAGCGGKAKAGAVRKCSACGKHGACGPDGKCAGCGGARPKVGAVMSTEKRESLPGKQFAIPTAKAKKIGVAGEIQGESKGKYPINDERHARNALSRVSTFGTPAERAAVRSKVYAKYPQLRAAFESSHGGESPTSKENLKKPTQGSIGKTGAVSETDAAKIKLVSGAMQQTKGMTVPQRKKVMKDVGKQIPNQQKTSSLKSMIRSFAKELVEIEKAAYSLSPALPFGILGGAGSGALTGAVAGGAARAIAPGEDESRLEALARGAGQGALVGGLLGGVGGGVYTQHGAPHGAQLLLPATALGPAAGLIAGAPAGLIGRETPEKTSSLRNYVQKLAYGDRY